MTNRENLAVTGEQIEEQIEHFDLMDMDLYRFRLANQEYITAQTLEVGGCIYWPTKLSVLDAISKCLPEDLDGVSASILNPLESMYQDVEGEDIIQFLRLNPSTRYVAVSKEGCVDRVVYLAAKDEPTEMIIQSKGFNSERHPNFLDTKKVVSETGTPLVQAVADYACERILYLIESCPNYTDIV